MNQKKSKTKVLITGGSGLLGKGMFETTPPDFSLESVHLKKYRLPRNAGKHSILDIRNKKAVDKFFEKNRFDVVIHAAGIASVDYVETNYAESLESNIVGTLNIASACRINNSKLIFISTNAVFDGTTPSYHEESPKNPVNEYGRIKLYCEELITKILPRALILRPILMYGWNHSTSRSNPVTWLIKKLRNGERVNIVNDVYENALYNIQCGDAIWNAILRDVFGIIHLAGSDSYNRYEMAMMTAEVFGLDSSLITPVNSSFFNAIAPRPLNTTFNTDRMRKILGVEPLTLMQGLLDMRKKNNRL